MTIRLEFRDQVGIVTIDRPPVNALDTASYRELDGVISSIEKQVDRCRALVLAGAGDRAFSAGADVKEFGEFLEPGRGLEMATRIHDIQNRLEALAMVSVAAVEAAALGGGCELILACDLRVAGEGARFGFPEVRVGQLPGTGGTMRLPWLIGESRARQLLLTGEPVSAQRALEIGLVHRLVPAGQALATAMSWARELARLPRSGIVAVKRSISDGRHGDTAERSAADAQLSETVFQSPEAGEGFRAFVEKRSPDYIAPSPQEVE